MECYTFDSCVRLKSILLPDTLEKIGEMCFQYSGLEQIVIPSKVTEIPERTFAHCKSLRSVTFAEGSALEKVGEESFKSTGLSEVIFPPTLKEVGANAFEECDAKVYVPCSCKVSFSKGPTRIIPRSDSKICGFLLSDLRILKVVRLPDAI